MTCIAASDTVREFVSICNVTPYLKVYIIYRTEMHSFLAKNCQQLVHTAMQQ
jgi:hypothetical protein